MAARTFSTPPRPMQMTSLVVGLGNVLLGDDGVGPAVCDELRCRASGAWPTEDVPEGIDLLDGGTLGAALAPWLADATALVIVDAVRAAGRPGQVLVYRSPDVPLPWRGCGAGLESVVAMARVGGLPSGAITLIGVIPDRIAPGMGLSRAVRTAVPLAASVVVREARALTGGIA